MKILLASCGYSTYISIAFKYSLLENRKKKKQYFLVVIKLLFRFLCKDYFEGFSLISLFEKKTNAIAIAD